ncbi:protein NETWORKED 3C-like [Eucalyptus grandis]|uniref:protein NETWORKED 3C-like n=1 Tax=Eucalyptus grandis TaxID=71139 RepID=UPI00192EE97C|nr:protein NETWORKED 3C-like [Eucalyptus grandis]
MEMEKEEGQASGSSHVEDGCSLLPLLHSQTSQWLDTTLSDADAAMLQMLRLVEDDGEEFVAERAEVYYHWRPELAEMLKVWHGCYCSLVRSYAELRSLYAEAITSSGSASASSSSSNRASKLGRRPGSAEDRFEAWKSEFLVLTGEELLKMCSLVQEALIRRNEEKGEKIEALVQMLGSREAELMRRHEEEKKKNEKLASRIKELKNENAELKKRLAAHGEAGRRRGRGRGPEEGSWLWKLRGFIVKNILRMCWFS